MEKTTQKRGALSFDSKPFVEQEAQFERAGRIEDLMRLSESRAREHPVALEACRRLLKAAQLARHRMKNHARAEDLLRRALMAVPSSKEALRGLRVVYEQKSGTVALVDILARLRSFTHGAESAAVSL